MSDPNEMPIADRLKIAAWMVKGASGAACLSGVLTVQSLRQGNVRLALQQALYTPRMALAGAQLARLGFPVVVTPAAVLGWVLRGMPQ